jgi:hypothetical protein
MPYFTSVKYYGSFGEHDRSRPASPPRLRRTHRTADNVEEALPGVTTPPGGLLGNIGDRMPGTTGTEAIGGMLGRFPAT